MPSAIQGRAWQACRDEQPDRDTDDCRQQHPSPAVLGPEIEGERELHRAVDHEHRSQQKRESEHADARMRDQVDTEREFQQAQQELAEERPGTLDGEGAVDGRGASDQEHPTDEDFDRERC